MKDDNTRKKKEKTINDKEQTTKQTVYIGVNIDWSKSFVDENGAFYCGTTQEQKNLTAKIMQHMDLVVYTTDFHSINSLEFKLNSGMWPLHNVAEYKKITAEKMQEYGLVEGTTISPEQTKTIDDAVNKTKAGIVVPRHVYYQDGKTALFTPENVEDAFGERIITPEEFLRENFTYIIAPKTHFDATRTVSEYLLANRTQSKKESKGTADVNDEAKKIPDREYTVFDLIAAKYPQDKYNLVFVNTGVVENICRHYTSTGLRQMFSYARVINLEGATTELAGIGLGFEDRAQVKDACVRISKDIGVEYKTAEALIAEIKQHRVEYTKQSGGV